MGSGEGRMIGDYTVKLCCALAMVMWSFGVTAQDPEPRGTVVGPEYCGDPTSEFRQRRGKPDTLYTRVSDGYGGTWRQTLEEGSDQCSTSTEFPPRRTVVGPDYCGNPNALERTERGRWGTLYTRVADGEGGTWRRTLEVDAGSCKKAIVSLVKESGDRFDPVRFDIYAPEGYSFTVTDMTIGDATMLDDAFLIHGSGTVGTGYVIIEEEEYSYEIAEEPRCASTSASGYVVDGTDCLGYSYSGPNRGFIYYGEEDTRIVDWELSYFVYEGRGDGPCGSIVELFERGSNEWNRAQRDVDTYNRIYAESGVFVRYVLKEGAVGRAYWCSNPGGAQAIVSNLNTVDTWIAKGYTCPQTCGCAYATRAFGYNDGRARGGVSACSLLTDLHEIGHGVGLAHGPDNSSNQANGYIWPEFGHGHSGGILCGADIMSYANGERHLNSNITCREMYGERKPFDEPTGDRTIADAAYHLNRIRYDVSLIHCKDDTCRTAPVNDQPPQYLDEILVEDWIDDIPNGRQLRERELDRLERQYGAGVRIR